MLFEHFLVYVISYFGIFTTIFFLLTLWEHETKNPKATKQPFVSVVIPAYNEQENIDKTINSVLALDWPKEKLEIIVVDDGSIDMTFEIAKKIASKQKQVRVFRKRNEGKASALNYGIAKAKGSIIASLDGDSFVSKNALKKMIGYFSDNRVMAVTPSLKIFQPSGILQRIQHVEYLLSIFLRKTFSFLNAVHVVPGPFSLYRKNFFEKYGMFDKKNITEDTEMALRIQSHGYKIENSIDAVVNTVSPKTFRGLLKQRMRWYYGFTKNAMHYHELFAPAFGDLGSFILPCAFMSVILVFASLFYFFYKFLTSIITNTRNLFLIKFDIMPLIDFDFERMCRYFYYMITNPLIIFLLVALACSLTLIMIAKAKSKERKNLKLSFAYFFALYWFIYGFWWLAAFVYKIAGGKIEWKKEKK